LDVIPVFRARPRFLNRPVVQDPAVRFRLFAAALAALALSAGTAAVQSGKLTLFTQVNLRASMQDTFRDVHRNGGQTRVEITHDQAEAMALADRVAVMDRGRLLQMASPDELYHRPETPTVAGFLGTSTVVPGTVADADTPDPRQIDLLGARARVRAAAGTPQTAPGPVMPRPGGLEIAESASPASFPVRVARRIYAGGQAPLRIVHGPAA
jgi:iron(III) transport system ATP-binding protein